MGQLISIPPLGKYTQPLRNMFERLDFNLLDELPITQKMIEKGCRHSSEMMCFPYKYTLAYFIESLEKGANTLLMFDSCGQCRLKQYYIVQDFTLKNLGYNYEMIPIKINHIFKSFKKIDKNLSVLKILRNLIITWKEIKEIDEGLQIKEINVGVIGEIYSCIESKLNFDIEYKIKKAGLNPYNDVTLSGFLKTFLPTKNKYLKQAYKFFNGELGGHGIENVASVLMMIEEKFKGIIWIRPLSCSPEVMVDPIIRELCNRANMPLLVLDIDETNAEANVSTRIETFFELIT